MKKALFTLTLCLLMAASFAAGAYSVLTMAQIDTDENNILISYAGQTWVHIAGK